MKGDELKERTKQFVLRIMKLVDALPNTVAGRVIANQIMRSGSSVGANYRAACRARSNAEFIAKLGTVLEESDETEFWLELIRDGALLPTEKVETLKKEAEEITAIMAASRKTAQRKK
jgi:four helix bundle protein